MPLAASVTVTHTLGVVALGLLVTAGSAAAPSVIAWLGIASGVMVACAGATLVRRAWRNRPRPGQPTATSPGTRIRHDHDHPPSAPTSAPASGRPRRAHPHARDRRRPTRRELVPRRTPTPTTASADHDHGPLPPARAHATRTPTTTPTRHDSHSHTVEHTHGGFTHTHATAPTLRGTILLGFAGGLVPSPSAVVVLVGAAALGQAWFGLLLVVAYGVGLALTLTAAGFAVVKLGTGMNRVLDRRPRWTTSPMATLVRRTAPLASAFVVVALGVGLVLKGAASALG